MASVPRVTMMELIPTFVIRKPLSAPMSGPTASPIRMITGIGMVVPGRLNSLATTTTLSPKMEPMDMSKFFVSTTGVRPTATMPETATEAMIALKLPRLKNLGLISEKTRTMSPYTTAKAGAMELLLKGLSRDSRLSLRMPPLTATGPSAGSCGSRRRRR